MAEPIDVLAILKNAALRIHFEWETTDEPDPEWDVMKAIKAVSELLAADEELDDARIAACQTSVVTPLDQFTAVMDRFYAAQQRRAAAIRAMRGEA